MTESTDAEALAAQAAADAATAAAARAAKAADAEPDDDEDDDDSDHDLSDAERLAKKLIEAQHGTYRRNAPEARACRTLVHDLWKLRAKNTKLRERAVDDGDVVLKKGSDVEAFKVLTASGIKPSELKTKLDQLEHAQAKLRDFEKNELFSQIADSLGYTGRGKKAFIRVAKKEGVDFQVKDVDVEVDGKKVKESRPFAKLSTEPDEKLRALDIFVEQDLGDYLPAFTATGSDEPEADDDPGSDRPHALATRSTPMVTQGRTSPAKQETAERGVTKSVLANRYKPGKAK